MNGHLGAVICPLVELPALLRFYPAIHQFLQNIERDGAVGEDDFMELPNIELVSKFLLRLLAQLQIFNIPIL
jgi:hypothetical protein